MSRRWISMLLAVTMLSGLPVPALAAEGLEAPPAAAAVEEALPAEEVPASEEAAPIEEVIAEEPVIEEAPAGETPPTRWTRRCACTTISSPTRSPTRQRTSSPA